MKKTLVLTAIAALVLLLFQALRPAEPLAAHDDDEIKSKLETSCFDCHSDQGKNKKARAALNFDSWDDYKNSKKIAKLSDIAETVREGKMPPEKYVNSKPEAALDEAGKKLLSEWAEQEAEKLMGARP